MLNTILIFKAMFALELGLDLPNTILNSITKTIFRPLYYQLSLVFNIEITSKFKKIHDFIVTLKTSHLRSLRNISSMLTVLLEYSFRILIYYNNLHNTIKT